MDAKTFSLMDAIRGRTYPEDSVTVYTDVAALYRLGILNLRADSAKTDEETVALEAEIAEVSKEIERSGLTFHMRGFDLRTAENIRTSELGADFAGDPTDEQSEHVEAASIAMATQFVTDVDGNHASAAPSRDDILVMKRILPSPEFQKLNDLTWDLTFRAWQYDAAVTPDFSQKS